MIAAFFKIPVLLCKISIVGSLCSCKLHDMFSWLVFTLLSAFPTNGYLSLKLHIILNCPHHSTTARLKCAFHWRIMFTETRFVRLKVAPLSEFGLTDSLHNIRWAISCLYYLFLSDLHTDLHSISSLCVILDRCMCSLHWKPMTKIHHGQNIECWSHCSQPVID